MTQHEDVGKKTLDPDRRERPESDGELTGGRPGNAWVKPIPGGNLRLPSLCLAGELLRGSMRLQDEQLMFSWDVVSRETRRSCGLDHDDTDSGNYFPRTVWTV